MNHLGEGDREKESQSKACQAFVSILRDVGKRIMAAQRRRGV
jgi:hypothetical protein